MSNENDVNQIVVIIDSHEEKLINSLRSEYLKKECSHLSFNVEALDCGDVVYKYNNQTICIIERKTNEDYVSSIMDGRSKNQPMRMIQLRKENPDIIILYLIEGPFIQKDQKYRNGINRDRLYSSMINKVIRDHLTIYRTADINDTALIITKIHDKLLEQLNNKTHHVEIDEHIEYLKTIKLAKKDNMTPTNCYICQLSQIPGVSIETANLIAQLYGSMSQLVLAYEKLIETSDRENLLSELQIHITNGKVRRLGAVLSKRIYDFIYCTQSITQSNNSKKIKLKLKES